MNELEDSLPPVDPEYEALVQAKVTAGLPRLLAEQAARAQRDYDLAHPAPLREQATVNGLIQRANAIIRQAIAAVGESLSAVRAIQEEQPDFQPDALESFSTGTLTVESTADEIEAIKEQCVKDLEALTRSHDEITSGLREQLQEAQQGNGLLLQHSEEKVACLTQEVADLNLSLSAERTRVASLTQQISDRDTEIVSLNEQLQEALSAKPAATPAGKGKK